MSTLSLLDWDSNFFNKKIGKIIYNTKTTESQLIKLLQNAQKENYELIYLFSDANITVGESILATFNGELVDTKVVFQKSIKKNEFILNSNITSFQNKKTSAELIKLAHLSGDFSRFKTDKNFSKQDFTKLYDEWLTKSVAREIATEVFVYSENKEILGFVTVSINNNTGNIGLIAVDPDHQEKKIGTHLLNHVENFLFSKNIIELSVPTQKRNSLACNFYLKNNFNLISSQNIYHFAINS